VLFRAGQTRPSDGWCVLLLVFLETVIDLDLFWHVAVKVGNALLYIFPTPFNKKPDNPVIRELAPRFHSLISANEVHCCFGNVIQSHAYSPSLCHVIVLIMGAIAAIVNLLLFDTCAAFGILETIVTQKGKS
jgi:hypothetical protein